MSRQRKTVDTWYIYVDYGQGFGEAECVEFGYYQFLVNREAYRENCPHPIRTRKGRTKLTDMPSGWSQQHNKLEELKAEVEYRQMMIRRESNEQRLNRLSRAEKNLSLYVSLNT